MTDPVSTVNSASSMSATESPSYGSMHRRYRDAYRVVTALKVYARLILILGCIAAALQFLIGAGAAVALIGESDSTHLVAALGVPLGLSLVTVLVAWILSVFIRAYAQITMATLDSAVNSSPLVTDAEKGRIIGL